MERKKVLEYAINYLMIMHNSIKTRPESKVNDLNDLNDCIALLTKFKNNLADEKRRSKIIFRVLLITGTTILTMLIVLVLSGVIQ